jgi:Response regulator containing CheY-like receiver, AAA-type ATPase, and DNA-binding domains
MNFLVADDSVEVLECLRKFLEKEGHSVRCTGDGEEALQIFQGEEIDAVFVH